MAVVKHTTAFPFRVQGKFMMCVYCADTFEEPQRYRLHMNESHTKFVVKHAFLHYKHHEDYVKVDATDLQCRECHLRFDTLNDAAEHVFKTHDSSIDLNADIGLQPFRFDKDKWVCFICKEICSQFTTLVRHMTSHYRKYSCEVCGKCYQNMCSLQYHVRFSHSTNFVCRKCKKTFSDSEARTLHLRTSEKCFPFCCTECGERFLSWESKKKHHNIKHGMPKVKFDCRYCGMSFTLRKYLSKHFKTHHNEDDSTSQSVEKQAFSEKELKHDGDSATVGE